jgi:hypothetical protein
LPIGGIPTAWELRVGDYRDYLSSLEQFLENEARILDERYDAEVQEAIEGKEGVNCGDYTLPGQLGEEESGALEYFFAESLRTLEDTFPNILRRSFFVTIFSLIEVQLNAICRGLERTGLPPFEESKKDDESIGRAKTYLSQAGIRLQDLPEWNELRNYQQLRNCIVHSEARLEGARHEEHLKQYIKSNSDKLEWISGREIVFRKEFCEEVLQVSHRFFTKLFAVLTSEEKGDL